MARAKSVTLKGTAAGAFMNALLGRPIESKEDARKIVATRIHMSVKVDDFKAADLILQIVEEKGILEAATILSSQRGPG